MIYGKEHLVLHRNKITIARKEAKETKYWLRLIAGKYIKTELLGKDVQEAQEIINILSAIINKTRRE